MDGVGHRAFPVWIRKDWIEDVFDGHYWNTAKRSTTVMFAPVSLWNSSAICCSNALSSRVNAVGMSRGKAYAAVTVRLRSRRATRARRSGRDSPPRASPRVATRTAHGTAAAMRQTHSGTSRSPVVSPSATRSRSRSEARTHSQSSSSPSFVATSIAAAITSERETIAALMPSPASCDRRPCRRACLIARGCSTR